MKKTTLLLIIILLTTFSIQAQTLSYEMLDEFSIEISKLQTGANGLTYNDGDNYEISFPEENFKVYYYNFLAKNSIYKKSNGKEILEHTENIDLSTTTSVEIIASEGSVVQMRLEFPTSSIKTQVFENGQLIETLNVSTVDFFVNKDYEKLYDNMIRLCHYLKKEKNIFNYDDIEDLAKKWEAAINKNSIAGFQYFLKNYPNTLYDAQANQEIQRIEKINRDERNRLEKIQIEKNRIIAFEEANRIKVEKERLARIAEEARLKELRRVGFGAFRIGFVSPTSNESKDMMATPAYISKGNNVQPLYGSSSSPYAAPYTKGQFGLKSGFSAGFTGIAHLEFINKKMPSRIGFGIPIDFNVAMMRYSWSNFTKSSDDYAFLYTNAKYGMWSVVSLGVGLSLSIRPADHIFIDLLVRPDFYLTLGGKYKAEGTKGNTSYIIETSRYDNSIGVGHTLGINFRIKKLMLGFEVRRSITDKQYFIEKVKMTENNYTSSYQYQVLTPGLKLNYMQMTVGVLF